MERNLIITENLVLFGSCHENDRIGNHESVTRELQEAVGMASSFFYLADLYTAAKYPEQFSYISDRKLLTRAAELSKEEVKQLHHRMMKKLQSTAKKITWLSTKSRELTGQPFVSDKINLMDANECYSLVKDFYLAAATATDVAVAF